MVGVPEILLIGLMFVLPVGCTLNWLAFFRARRNAEPFIAVTYTRSVPWGILDMGVLIVVLLTITGFGVSQIRSWAGIDPAAEPESLLPREQAIVFASFGGATLIATGLSLGWLFLRFGKHEALGVASSHLRDDLRQGVQWFTMLVVPVVLVQIVLTRWFPTQHPLIEMLRSSGNLTLLPVAAFAAVVSAPIFEEVFFRLLFQGWLEKLHAAMRRTERGLASRAERDAVVFGGESWSSWSGEPPLMDDHPSSESGGAASNPYQARWDQSSPQPAVNQPPEASDPPVAWTPIVLSSALFSLAHLGHGPDWIPLFFLALGLGYLYQRTHRILACIVVHMLVNSLGVLQLWAAMRQF